MNQVNTLQRDSVYLKSSKYFADGVGVPINHVKRYRGIQFIINQAYNLQRESVYH